MEDVTPLPYRRYTGMPLPIKLIAFFLAALLVISGIAFIVYSETIQYRVSFNKAATTVARMTRTAYLQGQGTANALDTAQSNIDASATAQADALVNATAAVDNATATAGALNDLYTQSTSGNPLFTDDLTDDTGPGHWDEGSDPNANTGCVFVNSSYVIREAGRGNIQPCMAQATGFSDFAYQANLTITKGYLGQAGLIFRTDSSSTSYYFFHIDTGGAYGLDLYGNSDHNLLQGVNGAIPIGPGQSNEIGVIANGNTIFLYANGEYLGSVTDHTLSTGKIGLGVVNRGTPVEVQFSNAKVWPLGAAGKQATPTAGETPTTTGN